MRIALTRDVSPAIARCELSHLERVPIDYDRALAQHAEYEELLMELGCRVHRLPADDTMPDAVFIEDTAVVVDELAVITRPGAPSRRGETAAVRSALAAHRPVASLEGSATLDGGDVLRLGRALYVGVSERTNREGIAQLARHLAPFEYRVLPVVTRNCLHLKTAATAAGPGIVIVNPDWVDGEVFGSAELVEVDPGEPFAANVLRVGGSTVCAAAYPRTLRRLEAAGVAIRTVDMSEFAKAEGGVTCCSVILDQEGAT
jgi:dimethylargininase